MNFPEMQLLYTVSASCLLLPATLNIYILCYSSTAGEKILISSCAVMQKLLAQIQFPLQAAGNMLQHKSFKLKQSVEVNLYFYESPKQFSITEVQMIKKNLIYARQRTSIIQNISKANKKAQIKDKQAARLRNHFALGLDPINSSSPQSKPSLVNDVYLL